MSNQHDHPIYSQGSSDDICPSDGETTMRNIIGKMSSRSPMPVRSGSVPPPPSAELGAYIEPRRIGRARSPFAPPTRPESPNNVPQYVPVPPAVSAATSAQTSNEIIELRRRFKELEETARSQETLVRENKQLFDRVNLVLEILRSFHILDANEDLSYLIQNRDRVYAAIPHITRDIAELTLDNLISSKLQTIEWKLKEFAPYEITTTATTYQRHLFGLIVEQQIRPYERGSGPRINKALLEIEENMDNEGVLAETEGEEEVLEDLTSEFNADLEMNGNRWLVKFVFSTLDRLKEGQEPGERRRASGGAQAKTMRDTQDLIEAQILYLNHHGEETDVYFVNILDGDRCWRFCNETPVLYSGKPRNRVKRIMRFAFKQMLEPSFLMRIDVPVARSDFLRQRIFIGDMDEFNEFWSFGGYPVEPVEHNQRD